MPDQENTSPSTPLPMDTEVQLNGKTFTLNELASSQAQLEGLQGELNRLNEFKQSTMELMAGNSNEDQRLQAARNILAESGYAAPDIERYISEYQESMAVGEEQFQAETPDNTNQGPINEEETMKFDSSQFEDSEARQEARNTAEEFRQYRLAMLSREMSSGVKNALDNNADVDVLLGRLKSGDNSEAFEKARGSLNQQVHDRTLKMLQDRKAREGNFNEAWVNDAAKQATEEVLGTYRTVIGDIDSIGRAPETVTGEPTLASKPHVPEPEYKPGMDRGVVDASVKDWNTDVLSRLAEESAAGDESKA